MELLVQDINLAVKRLWKEPRFSLFAALILAVCLGSNVAAFSLVHSVLLRALPFAEADRIVLIANQYSNLDDGVSTTSSVPHYLDRLDGLTAAEEQGLFMLTRGTVDIEGVPERVQEMTLTPSAFRVLGAQAAVGRRFLDSDAEVGATNAVILSYGLWQQLYAGDISAVGSDIALNGLQTAIVGVMPEGFEFMNPDVRLWIPMEPDRSRTRGIANRHANDWTHIARLRPEASIEELRAQVSLLTAAELDLYPEFTDLLVNAGFHSTVDTLRDVVVRDFRGTLYFLWGAAGLTLLVGIVNVGGIVLARSNLRRTEFLTRFALGARPVHAFRQLTAESMVLVSVAGCAGLVVGVGALRMFSVAGLSEVPRAGEVRLDATVLLGCAIVSLLAGLGISLIQFAHVLSMAMKGIVSGTSRSTGGRGTRRISQGLVVTQIALTCVLLAAAGLLLESYRNVLDVEPGFNPERVLTASIAPNQTARRDLFVQDALEVIRNLPGVEMAGATTSIPFGGNEGSIILVEGRQLAPGEPVPSSRRARVTPGYFETLEIDLLRGRYFDDRDVSGAQRVAVVDQQLAAALWPDADDPIGKRLYLPGDADNNQMPLPETPFITVVGVVEDVVHDDLANASGHTGTHYFPYAQDQGINVTFTIRTSIDPERVISDVRSGVAGPGSLYPLFDIVTMTARLDSSLVGRRASLWIASVFAGLALLLSSAGTYGMVAYSLSRRTREIAVRIALGSPTDRVLRLLLREGWWLLAWGLVVGLAAALALGRLIESQIYGVRATDPMSIGLAVVTVSATVLTTCLWPAHRATRINLAATLKDS